MTEDSQEPASAKPLPKVLVVEDHPETQQLIRLVLRKGYEVLTATSAEEARTRLEVHGKEIKAILMDVMLQGREDGFELTRSIRSDPRWSSIPIIFETVRAGPEDRSTAFAAGCIRYLTKPFYPSELRTALEHCI